MPEYRVRLVGGSESGREVILPQLPSTYRVPVPLLPTGLTWASESTPVWVQTEIQDYERVPLTEDPVIYRFKESYHA